MPHNDLKKSTCRGCGRPIIWGETATGTRIPLDATAPVYQVVKEEIDPSNPAAYKLVIDRAPGFVSHFATCSQARSFSKNRKKGEDNETH